MQKFFLHYQYELNIHIIYIILIALMETIKEITLSPKSVETYKAYNYELAEILNAIKKNQNTELSSEYKTLKHLQLKTVLKIVHIIETNFRPLEEIKSDQEEKEYIMKLIRWIEHRNLLSPSMINKIEQRINTLVLNRIKLKFIKEHTHWEHKILWWITVSSKQIKVMDYTVAYELSEQQRNDFKIANKLESRCSGINVTNENGWNIIYYPKHNNNNTLKHEIRHSKNSYLLSQNQSRKEYQINDETTAYAFETGNLMKWEWSIAEYEHVGNDQTTIKKVYEKIRKVTKLNLDLLSITPLHQRSQYFKKETLCSIDNFCNYDSDSIITPNKGTNFLTAQSACDAMEYLQHQCMKH